MFNHHWCKRADAALRNGESVPAYYLFLSGCGGTGKSDVIKMIHRDVNYFFNIVQAKYKGLSTSLADCSI